VGVLEDVRRAVDSIRPRVADAAWPAGAPAPRVAVIGAGFSGLGMAVRLRQHGIESFTIYEKASSLGGTWRDNTYPGAACDVPSHLYSFSFHNKRDWTRKFAEQPEILDYLEHLADEHGLRGRIRFDTEVVSAEFDDATLTWRLRTTNVADGTDDEAEVDVLVAGTGQLNRPYVPELAGLEDFEGVAFHSARWRHDHDLHGRDVAVIGNGASAIQFVPPVAEQARSVTIFQRSTNYVAPKPDRAFRERERWVLAKVAPVQRLYRWSIYWRLEARFLLMRRDSRLGRWAQKKFADGLRPLVSDRLTETALVPDYPIGCKRILISNDWYPAITRPSVRTVTSPIEHIERDAVVTADGERHRADTIIFGTGFEATRFLGPMDVWGSGGRKLDDAWADGAEAHLGITVAGFPNLFLLYGPNTNLGHNSILVMVERQIEYVLRCLDAMADRGARAIDVAPEAMASYNDRVQRDLTRTVWAAACHSWYKTATGRITQNWPSFTVAYWRDTWRPRLRDFAFRR
jgi:cation diffusion facilitator CzcD-associated flavoprotein CzcO